MRFIDENGRLFGKINVIDFLAILFLFCLMPMFYFGYRIVSKQEIAVQDKVFTEMEINCKFVKLNPEICKLITVGDKEVDENGIVTGEIIWLGKIKPYQYEFNIGSGELVNKLDPELKEVPVRLKVKLEVRENSLYYRDKQIMVNLPFEFKSSKYTVTIIPNKDLVKNLLIMSETKKPYMNLYCKFVKLNPEICKLITVGDKEVDENGIVTAEIIWLGKIKPYQYEFNIGSGELVNKLDPELKEVPVRLKVKLEVRENSLYYKDKQITLNSYIDFETSKYKIEAIPLLSEITGEKIELNIILKNIDPEILNLISIGDKEINKDGEVIAEIVKIGKVDNSVYEINLGSGNFAMGNDEHKKQVNVTMKIMCEIDRTGQLYFKGKKVTYDSFLEFITDEYTAEGKLTNLLINERWIEVKVKFSGVIPELASFMAEGDKEKSPEGKIMARLKSIKSNKPSDTLMVKETKYITVSHPFQKDIEVILNLLCIEKDGALYFKNFPVKIGNMIVFATEIYSINGIITGLENI